MPAREFETGSLTIAVMQSDAFGQEFHATARRSRCTSTTSRPHARSSRPRASSSYADTIDSGVCHMAIFTDPDGNPLMFHHRYAPKDAKPGG